MEKLIESSKSLKSLLHQPLIYLVSNNSRSCLFDSIVRIFSVTHLVFWDEDDKIVAAVGHKIRVVSLDDGKEVLKFSSSLDSVQCILSSGDAKFLVASGDGEKRLQLWKCDFGTRNVDILSTKHRPLSLDFRNGCDGEGVIVLSVSEADVTFVWNLKFVDDVNPTKLSVKDDTSKLDYVNCGRAKRNHISIIAARIHAFKTTGHESSDIIWFSDGPQFTAVDIATPYTRSGCHHKCCRYHFSRKWHSR